MNQTEDVELTNGTLVLDEERLRAAHIKGKARIVVNDHSIEILPIEEKILSPVERTWGILTVPDDVAVEMVESKELEYDL